MDERNKMFKAENHRFLISYSTLRVLLVGIMAIVCTLTNLADEEDYQFIISNGYDPIFESTNNCSVKASDARSFTTGTLSFQLAVPFTLEARFRTWFESVGRALNTTKYRHFSISFR